jgi:hypothetical protein
MALRALRAVFLLLSSMFAVSAFAQTTVTLQQDQNGYTGTTDARLWATNPTINYGANTNYSVSHEAQNSSVVVRFAIFQSEGGPVPNDATITSATLSLFKFSGLEATIKASRLLKNWNEAQATWNVAATGTSWTTAGANSSGSDYVAAPDGQAFVAGASGNNCGSGAPGTPACWLNIDVTSGVQAFKASPGSNFGWKLAYVSGGDAFSNKDFVSRDSTNSPTLRPKLTITYTIATPPTTATLRQGLNSYTGTTDARLWATNPTTNYGTNTNYSVSHEAQNSSVVVRFAIFASEGGPVPNDATITSATLSLFKFAGLEATIKASRLLKNWNEAQATWNVAATGTSWTTAGANSSGSDYVAAPDGQAFVAGASGNNCGSGAPGTPACWLNIDVTSGVQAFKADPAGTNFGWKLAYVSGGDAFSNKDFVSKDSTNSPTLRPTLTITYTGGTGGGGPTVPNASYTWSQVSGTLGVQFNAGGTSDGGSAITQLRLLFGHGSPEEEQTWTNKDLPQTHTFPGPGQYNVTLTATNSVGTSAPFQQPITVAPVGGGDEDIPPAAPGSLAGDLGFAVPTFHSMSLYYQPSAPSGCSETNPSTPCKVWMRYRKSTEPDSAWREGHPLWYDARNSGTNNTLPFKVGVLEYRARGSAVYLEPGTKYYFQFGTGTSHATANFIHYVEGKTWPDSLPEDPNRTIVSQDQGATYVITQGGSASAYKVYDFCQQYSGTVCVDKTVIDRAGTGSSGPAHDRIDPAALNAGQWPDSSFAVVIRANFVIVRNVVAKSSVAAGILVYPNFTDIVIEDSEIYDWSWRKGTISTGNTPPTNPVPGWENGAEWGINNAGGIHLSGNNSRIVLQRNIIRDPHLGSSPWGPWDPADPTDMVHPAGPAGITMFDAGTQNVVRYNEIYSSIADRKHWFNDGLIGRSNFSAGGAPGPDSDIYNNIIRNVYDDGIEAEGGGRNVRVWGNYMDHVGVGIATSTVHFGPTYVFRNVVNRVRQRYDVTSDSGQSSGIGFKAYGFNGGFGGGRQYFFNNTFLQMLPSQAGEPGNRPLGPDAGLISASGGQGMRQTWSRNNILHIWDNNWDSVAIESGGGWNDFDHDIHNGDLIDIGTNPSVFGSNIVRFGSSPPVPQYKAQHGPLGGPRLHADGPPYGEGRFQLSIDATGEQWGTQVPNFTTGMYHIDLARKSGVEVVTGACNARGDPGCPDVGAHQSTSAQPMKFGIHTWP